MLRATTLPLKCTIAKGVFFNFPHIGTWSELVFPINVSRFPTLRRKGRPRTCYPICQVVVVALSMPSKTSSNGFFAAVTLGLPTYREIRR